MSPLCYMMTNDLPSVKKNKKIKYFFLQIKQRMTKHMTYYMVHIAITWQEIKAVLQALKAIFIGHYNNRFI